MKQFKYIAAAIIILSSALSYAAEISLTARGGYSPAVGGSMSSGWQSGNLDAQDGINDINRSKKGVTSTIEVPTGVVAGADLRLLSGFVYYRAGIEYVYTVTGGKGKTLNGTEVVDVTYSQWFFDVPVTIGVALLFWGESRIYLGGGAAYAYGTYSNSFKSDTLDHKGSFTTYAVPLVAEIGCEYMLNDYVSLGAEIKYLYGKSRSVEEGTDYAKVDFTGFHITAAAALHFNI